MTAKEFNDKQLEKWTELAAGPDPETQLEKDIWNLKIMRYSIRHGSLLYRRGCIKTLDKTIAKLEKEFKEKENVHWY